MGYTTLISWCRIYSINSITRTYPRMVIGLSQFALNIFQGLTRNDVNQPLTTTMESLEFAEVVCDWTFVNAAVIVSACVLQLLCFAEWRLQTNWFGWFQNCVKSSQFWCLKLKVLSFTQALFNTVPCSVLPRVYLLCLVNNRFFGRILYLFFSRYHLQANKTTMSFYRLVLSLVSY